MLKVNVRTDRSGHWLEHSILHLVEEAASLFEADFLSGVWQSQAIALGGVLVRRPRELPVRTVRAQVSSALPRSPAVSTALKPISAMSLTKRRSSG